MKTARIEVSNNKKTVMKKIFLNILFWGYFFITGIGHSFGQCTSYNPWQPLTSCGPEYHCDCDAYPKNGLVMENSPNINFDFEKMSDYTGGITLGGATIVHIRMSNVNAACADGFPCKWRLVMYVDNFGAPANAKQWDKTATYGTGGGSTPSISLLQVRVYNGCNTPLCEDFQPFTAEDGAAIDIVRSTALNSAGGCSGTNVNGTGSYLTDYNEFTFTVDYRIVPGYDLAPGNYQLMIHFCLVED
ncbi:MAG: hypothetical protein ACLQQ4_11490 [Bacteroidia bacterium]